MELVIAEKPSVARDIARVLGVRGRTGGDWLENEQYAITWCIGHLVELDEPGAYDEAWKPWRLDRLPMLPEQFRLRPANHAKQQLRTVTKLLKDRRFSAVINACDAGREGELIFRYVYQYAKSRLPVRRLWISSLTDEAIRRGFAAVRPGREYDALADAACSRSEADWLVGMNTTRAMTVRGRTAGAERGSDTLFSIGRVQTPTLALLVRREHEIRQFVPTPYWEVRGEFRTDSGAAFAAIWRHGKQPRLAAADLADAVVARDLAHAAFADPVGPRVVGLTAKTAREPAPQLFDLTTLQRTANRRFGFSAARTLEIAQALYERHKLVTYPRTDSRHLSADVARTLPALFEALAAVPDYAPFARKLVEHPPRPGGRFVDDSKVSDHHAIIPTGTPPRSGLDRDEARLFDLIVRRFLGAFFPDAEIAVTEVWIRVGAGDGPAPELAAADRERLVTTLPPPPDHFLARGRVRMVAGWQEVAGIDAQRERRPGRDDSERDDEPTGALPVLVVGQRLAGSFASLARETTPPPRYTEASLLAAMESAGKQIASPGFAGARSIPGGNAESSASSGFAGARSIPGGNAELSASPGFAGARSIPGGNAESIDDEALRAAMKDVGLGTPATRAAIIETLLRRKYIVRERQHLVPTPTGMSLLASLAAAKVDLLASPELTGNWEARLARVARGEETRASFMADIARYVTDVIDAIRGGGGGAIGGGMSSPALPRPPVAPVSPPLPRPPVAPVSPSLPRPPVAPVSAPGSDARAGARGSTAARPASANGRARPAAPVSSTTQAASPTPRRHAAADRVPAALRCPRCKQGTLIAGNRGWGCGRWRDGCRFVIWFQTAGKRLTEAQLQALITKGKTRKSSFRDARGNAIDGRLVLDVAREGGVHLERA